MEGDKEEDLQGKTEFPDEEKLCTWREVDMDLDTICSSPRAISPLTGLLAQETHMDVRKRIPTERGRQFEIQKLKENRKTALANLTKQINLVSPLLTDFENEKQVRTEVVHLDQLFVKVQEAHDAYLKALDDDDEIKLALEWFGTRDKDVLQLKQRIIGFLDDADKLRGGLRDTHSVKSKSSRRSRHSLSSATSARLRLIEAKAKAAALEVKASFLKEKQALKMATEELELRQQIAEARAEEKTYEKFEKEQNIDGMNENSEDVEVKLTSTTISPGVQSNDQATLRVPSVKFQSSAIVGSTTTPVTTPALVSAASMNPTARPFVPKSVPIKEEEYKDKYETPTDYKPPHVKRECTCSFGKDSSSVDGTGLDQNYLDIQRKQAELSEMIVTQQARSLLPSHKPPTFSGDVMSYPAFITAFETIIEFKVDDSNERLYYLDQYTSGKAKELIKGCLQMKGEDSYKEARRLLKKHFGDPYKIASAYIAKLSSWPAVKPNDGTGLQEFSIVLEQARNAMTGMQYMNDLNTANVMRQLWERLPRYLRSKWTERVSRIRSVKGQTASFNDFCQFVSEQADLATDPIYSEEGISKPMNAVDKYHKQNERKPKRGRGTNFATGLAGKNAGGGNSHPISCTLCSKAHHLDECAEFLKKPLVERRNFIKQKGLCFGCYSCEHIAKLCKGKRTCRICNKKHPTSLHDYSWKSEEAKMESGNGQHEKSEASKKKTEERVVNVCTAICNVTDAGDVPVAMGIIPVWLYHKDNPNNKICVYALLDNASGGTFIKEDSLRRLGVKGSETKLLLTTMHGTQEVDTKAVDGLMASHFQENDVIVPLPRTYVRQRIPADRDEIPRPEELQGWSHLQMVRKHVPPYMEDVEIGLLIGLNCPSAVRPRDIVCGNENEPYAVRSLLGWHVNGPVNQKSSKQVHCNRIQILKSNTEDNVNGYIIAKTEIKERLTPQVVSRMFEMDFAEREHGVALSREDRQFLKIVEDGIHHRDDMHYEMPLPFREKNVQLPNNRPQAEQRLHGLKKRLQGDARYRADYVRFMTEIIEKGYARKVKVEELPHQEGKAWYLPHHGVYHPKKPGSIRVVFDCSARYQGESLNGHLLQGPDLTNKLTGVLTRFREEKVAFMADIEKMFFQVKVPREDHNFLRFLWWPNGDLTQEPQEYCMTVHLFGAGSSPGYSNFALKRTAEDGEREFGAKAAETLRKNFYVDDALSSVPTEKDAVELVQAVKEMCAKGGFKLTKFVSNSRKVMMSVPAEDRAKEIKGLDLGSDKLPIERALGVEWCIESDAFKFRIELKDKPCTRRGILATISSIFDPLGLIAPVVLVGKQILQEICHGKDWDEPIEGEVLAKWGRWRSQLPLLEQLNIPRNFQPPDFGSIATAQLHNMSDASQVGYGQCSYLRLVDENGRIHCSLVMGKARVAPLKTVTIPRLELTAATVSVRVASMLKEELDYGGLQDFYWTDSKVVLGFINNESRRFQVYVANRVQFIRDHTSPDQWRYVESGSNPADEASRGMNAKEFMQRSQWIKGPDFLWQTEDHWPQQDSYEKEVDHNSPDVKGVTANATVIEEHENMLSRFKGFSKWQVLKGAVALCMEYKRRLKMRASKADKRPVTVDGPQVNGRSRECEGCPATSFMVRDLEQAETEILKLVQANYFDKEIKILKDFQTQTGSVPKDRHHDKERKAVLKKSSSLNALDPYLDASGMLRVGGRIKKANLSDSLKNPVILPKAGHITELVLRHAHEKTHHSGRGLTLNERRSSGYWIINGNAAVRHFISKCVTCRHLRGTFGEQKMANLPSSRVEPAPQFSYCAVDYFGPWYVKEGRKEVKRYGALFTCLASRAVHIEVAHSMETDSFLQALRRFTCRRGPIRELRSDQGTNFVGAENELKAALREMDDEKIKAELLKENIDWIRNPATASNFGGVWERQIRSVRNIMAALMKQHGHSLNDESLRTLLCEAEAVVNSRPLTTETLSDPLSPLPLSPSTLLTGKTKLILPPPGKFQREDTYCKRRWRRVQHIANEFWNRWSKEYLQILQLRQKWTHKRRNFTEGDIVLLKDNNSCRNKWPMAKVLTTRRDDEGQVRSVTVQTGTGSVLDRPVNKLVLLLESPKDRPGIPDEEPEEL